eukprot:1518867-Rhodomonas_salina.1
MSLSTASPVNCQQHIKVSFNSWHFRGMHACKQASKQAGACAHLFAVLEGPQSTRIAPGLEKASEGSTCTHLRSCYRVAVSPPPVGVEAAALPQLSGSGVALEDWH